MTDHRATGAAQWGPLPAPVRRWLYLIAAAVVPLLVAYGVLTDATAPLWLALAAAVLGGGVHGLAAANTPRETSD